MSNHHQPNGLTANQPTADSAPDITGHKGGEEVQRPSEEKYRLLFETMTTGFALGEAMRDESGKMINYRLLELNPAFRKLTGIDPGEAVGKTILEVLPGLDPWWLDTYQQVVDSRETIHVEEFIPQLDRWYDVTAFYYGEERFAAYYSDITERKRHEVNLAFLAEVGQDLAALTNIDETMNALGAKIGRHFKVADVIFSEVSEDGQTVHVTHEWHRGDFPAMKGDYRIKEYFSPEFERLHRAGKIAIVRDTANDERVDAAAYARLGVGTLVNMPLIHQNKWRFNFTLNDAKPRDWRPDEVELVRELITRIWARLERARAEETLAASEGKFRTLFETMEEGFALCEGIRDETGKLVDYRVRLLNPAYERLTGLKPEDALGKRALEIASDMEDGWFETFQQVLDTGQTSHFEQYHPHFNRWYEVKAFRYTDNTFAYLYNDVTERKQSDQHQAFLLNLSDTLRAQPNADAIATCALQRLAEQLELDRCYIGVYRLEEDRGEFTHQVGNDRVPPVPDSVRLSDFPDALRVAFEGTLVIDDVGQTTGLTDVDRQNLGALGFSALVASTLRHGERHPLWSMVAISARPRRWRPAEIKLIDEVTERTWDALERARVEEALRESQKRLSAVFAALPVGVGVTDTQGTLVLANQQMQRYLPTGILPSRDNDRGSRWQSFQPDGSPTDRTDFPGARALRGEQVMPGIDMRYTQDDGTPIWTHVTAVPILSDEGQITGQVSVVTDIDALKRGEEALRQSQEWLRLALDASGMGTFRWYPQEDRTEADARALTLLGLGENDPITLAESLATRIHPDDRQLYAAAVARAVDWKGDGKLDLDYRIVQPDGSLHWLHIYGHTFFSGENPARAALMYGLFHDITERKRHEANLAFLAEVSRDLVHLKTIDETMNALGAKIGRHFTATRCSFFEFNEAMDSAVCHHDWHQANQPSLVGSYRTADFYTDEFLQTMRAGEAFVVRDSEADARADAKNLAALDIASCIVVPIITDQQLLFVLSINDSEARDWRDEEIELMRELTSRIWTRLERARAEEAIRESEKRFRLAIEATGLGTWEWDLETDKVYWSEQHFRLFGMEHRSNSMGLDAFFNYVHPTDREGMTKLLQKAIVEQSIYVTEFRAVLADGSQRWMSHYGRVVETRNGKSVRLSGVTFDINDRRETEHILRRSDERFRTLVQNLPDYAIFRINPQGMITEWTEGAQRVKGYTAEEVVGQSIALFYTPEGLAAGELTTEMEQAGQTGRAERESVRIRKGGERFWVNEIMTAIHEEGRLVGFTKISRDITGRKKADEALFDSRQRLQIVLDSIADHAVITIDPQNRIVSWNPGASQMFGYTAEEAIGQSGAIIFTPEDRATAQPDKELEMARRQGRAPDERYHLRKDGSRLYVSGTQAPLYNADQTLLGYVKVARDLTERRRMEQALREADGRKDEFLAMLAHELRNPMSTIRSGLQILTFVDAKDQTSQDTIALMNRQVDHLVRMVDDLLDVSRISRGKIELKRERLELGTLVAGAVDAMRLSVDTGHKSLHLSPSPAALFVQGDPTRLTQVVTNLLTNGLRYTGPQGQVWVSLAEANGEALLRVSDDGIGLSEPQLTAIFELFVQADNSPARTLGGLGVGLTLARRLAELHGGRLEASSGGLGKGSTFTVYLPLAQPPKNRPAALPIASSTSTQRLLVIDDNADAALMLSMLLKMKGYEVHSRLSGRAGIEAAESLRPAVILCDIGMPELDGYATCRLIREQPWGQSMSLIALTGYGGEEDKALAREAGFDAHLVKPVSSDTLLALLTSLLPTG